MARVIKGQVLIGSILWISLISEVDATDGLFGLIGNGLNLAGQFGSGSSGSSAARRRAKKNKKSSGQTPEKGKTSGEAEYTAPPLNQMKKDDNAPGYGDREEYKTESKHLSQEHKKKQSQFEKHWTGLMLAGTGMGGAAAWQLAESVRSGMIKGVNGVATDHSKGLHLIETMGANDDLKNMLLSDFIKSDLYEDAFYDEATKKVKEPLTDLHEILVEASDGSSMNLGLLREGHLDAYNEYKSFTQEPLTDVNLVEYGVGEDGTISDPEMFQKFLDNHSNSDYDIVETQTTVAAAITCLVFATFIFASIFWGKWLCADNRHFAEGYRNFGIAGIAITVIGLGVLSNGLSQMTIAVDAKSYNFEEWDIDAEYVSRFNECVLVGGVLLGIGIILGILFKLEISKNQEAVDWKELAWRGFHGLGVVSLIAQAGMTGDLVSQFNNGVTEMGSQHVACVLLSIISFTWFTFMCAKELLKDNDSYKMRIALGAYGFLGGIFMGCTVISPENWVFLFMTGLTMVIIGLMFKFGWLGFEQCRQKLRGER